jgi:hypothetical protein
MKALQSQCFSSLVSVYWQRTLSTASRIVRPQVRSSASPLRLEAAFHCTQILPVALCLSPSIEDMTQQSKYAHKRLFGLSLSVFVISCHGCRREHERPKEARFVADTFTW